MRICYIGDGGSVHNHFMVDWFVNAGHDVLFLTDTPNDALNCEVRQVAKRYGVGYVRHLFAAWKVRNAIREWKPDVVHAHNVTGYGYWGALAGFSPLAMTAWGSDLNVLAQKNLLVNHIVKHTLKKADLITGDAEALCNTARQLAGSDRDVRLLQWGVDLKQFNRALTPEVIRQIRKNTGFVFISTRRLRENYNIDVIIKAFAEVHHNHPDTRLLVVGADIMMKELKQLAAELNVKDRVEFLGWVDQDDLISAMMSADAFISVPSSDSTALSLLEAFAAKLPVIVADLEANREWVEHGVNGILVKPRNVGSLAHAMTVMIENQVHLPNWGAKNLEIVERRGNRDIEMMRLEEWYEELIQKNGKPS